MEYKSKLNRALRRNKLGLSILAFTWLGFFWRLLFNGQLYFSDDIKLVFYPLEHVYGLFQRAGHLPLWSNLFGFGHPLLSWGQLGFFTPLHLLLRQLNVHPLEIINISMMVHFALGLLGLFVFLRRRGISQVGSSLGAVIFVFSGYNVSHIVHSNFFIAVMLMPWLLVAIDVFVKKANVRSAVLLGAMAGLIVISGHAQIALYCLILASIVALFIVEKYSWRIVALVMLAAVIGITLSAITWLPLMEFLPYVDRTEGMTTQELYNFSYPPWHIITLIFPTIFGDSSSYWGAMSYLELGAFVGIIPLLLAGIGIITVKTKFKKEKRLALTLLLLGIVLSLGKYFPIYRLLVERGLFPPFTAPGRWLMFFVFGVAVLSALGIDILTTRWEKKSKRELIGAVGLVAILLLPFLVSEYGRKLAVDSFEWWVGISGLAWFAIAWVLPKGKMMKGLWLSGCVGLTITTIIVFGWRLYPLTDRDIAFAPSVFTEEIAAYKTEFGVPARTYSNNVLLRKSISIEEEPGIAPTKRTDRLASNFSVHQKFVATSDDLACLYLAIESDRQGDDPVVITLSAMNGGNVVRQMKVKPQDITDAGHQRFCFKPIRRSANQQFMVSFNVAGEGSNVTLFYQPEDVEGQAYLVRVQNPTAKEFEKSRKDLKLVMDLEYGKEITREQILMMGHLNVTANASGARWIGSLSIRRYRDFVKQLFDNDKPTIDGDGVHVLEKNRKIFNLAGVTHFMQALEEGATDGMADNGFTMLAEKKVRDVNYRLYKNDQALPRAYIVPQGIMKKDRAEVFRAMMEPQFNPAETIFIEDYDSAFKQKEWPISSKVTSDVEIIKYEATRVDIKVKTSDQSWLVLTDSFTPLWQLYIDDKKAPRFIASQLFKTALVPKGGHVISWRYESKVVGLALWFSGISLVIVIMVLAKGLISMGHFIDYEDSITNQNKK